MATKRKKKVVSPLDRYQQAKNKTMQIQLQTPLQSEAHLILGFMQWAELRRYSLTRKGEQPKFDELLQLVVDYLKDVEKIRAEAQAVFKGGHAPEELTIAQRYLKI